MTRPMYRRKQAGAGYHDESPPNVVAGMQEDTVTSDITGLIKILRSGRPDSVRISCFPLLNAV